MNTAPSWIGCARFRAAGAKACCARRSRTCSKRWGRSHDLQFIAEHDLVTRQGTRIHVDGALLHGLRVPFGYWEAKDERDDLEAEIAANTYRFADYKESMIALLAKVVRVSVDTWAITTAMASVDRVA